MGHHRLSSFIFLLLCGCLVGCGGSPDQVPSAESAALFRDGLAEARDGGASDAQISQLEAAVDTGEVSLEAAREAARRTVDCMTAAGLDATYVEQELSSSLIVPGFEALTPDSQAEASVEACSLAESHWVNQVYQLQPSSRALVLDQVERQAPSIQKCLEEAGYPPPEDATPTELADHAAQVAYDTSAAVDCLTEAGVTGW